MKLALLFLLCAQTQQPMSFKVPDGTQEADIKATVTVLTRRISDYGYRDIKIAASADGKLIQVFSEAPLNNSVRAKLYSLATVQANAVEVRFVYQMTDAESEQYRPGEAAPKHSSWMKWKGGWVLMRDNPTYAASIKWYPKKKDGIYDKTVMDASHLAFDEGTAKALALIPKELVVKIRLFIDDKLIDLGGNIFPQQTSFRWTIGNTDGWDVLGVCVNNPIPIKLSH